MVNAAFMMFGRLIWFQPDFWVDGKQARDAYRLAVYPLVVPIKDVRAGMGGTYLGT